MRQIVGLIVLLLIAGWLACHFPANESVAVSSIDDGWRRTNDGWQHRSNWVPPGPPHAPPLHPAVVAVLECLLAVTSLVAFCPAGNKREDDPLQAVRRRAADQLAELRRQIQTLRPPAPESRN